jgi:hypothetical protein
MFKRILVVGMMLLSGVASAQQAEGETTLDVSLSCYPVKRMVEAVFKLNYKPLLTAHSPQAPGTYSAWIGPKGEFLLVATNKDLSCIVVDAVESEFILDEGGTL